VFALGGAGPADPLLAGGLAEGSVGYFRAVALDFDGTLADGLVAPATLAALTEARARGVRVILVTGRIMSELRAVFPEVDEHVDAVVAENGALLVTRGGVRVLAAPVGRAVSAALTGRWVAHRSGQVLIAGAAAHEPAALEVVRELGLDCQLIRNRGELMILPAGVTKGSGLLEALGELGLSPHNAIGGGDAENDHSLLDACEVGVAVANAVDALRAHADMVLPLPDGPGVADLLRGPLLAGRARLHPRRWQVMLGTDDGGEPVMLPGSRDSPEHQGIRAPYVGGQLTRLRRQALPGNSARRAPIGLPWRRAACGVGCSVRRGPAPGGGPEEPPSCRCCFPGRSRSRDEWNATRPRSTGVLLFRWLSSLAWAAGLVPVFGSCPVIKAEPSTRSPGVGTG